MTTIHLSAAKGGQGTSTVASFLAKALAEQGNIVTLVDPSFDCRRILGLSPREDVSIDTLTVVTVDTGLFADITIVDGGQDPDPTADRNVIVTRPCYVALARAVESGPWDGAIVVTEEGRALGPKDVQSVLSVPILAEIPIDPTVARAIDAGFTFTRRPQSIVSPLQGLIRDVVTPIVA